MPDNSHAERVIVISMMKSGTHLIKELMVALGYGVYGHLRVTPEARPVLDTSARWHAARMVYDDERLASLKAAPEQVFNNETERAWEALAWSWQSRFGMPLTSWYGTELTDSSLVEQARHRAAGSSFAETPAGVCWVFHEFDATKIDGTFLREWAATGEPRIIFNYRDPRDAMVSLVNFLCGGTKAGISAFSNLRVYRSILLAMAGLEERLTYALADEYFPCQARDFKRMYWLLHHPSVCKTSFEELVGPNGGGTAESQLQGVARLMSFLGVADRSPEEVVGALFNREAYSFFKGQIGSWREVFTDEHRRLAQDRLGEVLSLYGYA
jgi:hypothetical protein